MWFGESLSNSGQREHLGAGVLGVGEQPSTHLTPSPAGTSWLVPHLGALGPTQPWGLSAGGRESRS